MSVLHRPAPSLYLFLDFDGVLHDFEAGPYVHHLKANPPILNPRTFSCLPHLENAVRKIEATGRNVQIHLSTSWRTVMPLASLRAFLGPFIGERTVACIPVLGDGSHRDLEVFLHLKELDAIDSGWICLDDNPDLYRKFNAFEEFRRRVFITDPDTGLTARDVERLVALAATV